MATKELKVHNEADYDIQTRLYNQGHVDGRTLPNYSTITGKDSDSLFAENAEFFSIKTPHGTEYEYEVKPLKNVQLKLYTTFSDASHVTNVFDVEFGKNNILPPDKGEVEIKSSRPGHS